MIFGRIDNIKKTIILKISAITNLVFALTFMLLSLFYFKNYDVIFPIFLLFLGEHLMVKSLLFHSDSSCFAGVILFLFGVFEILDLKNNFSFKPVFYLLIFSLTSGIVGVVFKQLFQMFFALLIAFEGLFLFIYLAKLSNLTIFLVLNSILLFIFLVFCAMIVRKFKREV